jgi:O-antigen/teichoic acid export membrane protein
MPAWLKRFAAYGMDNGLSAVFGILLLIAAARTCSLEEFGALALALSIAGVQTPLAVIGISGLFYARAASRPAGSNRLFRSGLLANLVAGVVIYGITLCGLWALASPDLAFLYALAGLRVLGAFGEPVRAIHQARSDPAAYVPLRFAVLCVALGATAAAFALEASAAWYAAIWGMEWLAFALGLLGLSVRRQLIPRSRSLRLGPLLTQATPLLIQAMCVAIYMRFDQLYVGWRFGAADLAVYAAAARVAEAGNLVVGLMVLVIGPRIIREWLGRGLSGSSWFALGCMTGASILGAAIYLELGEELLSFVFGAAFGAGALVLAIYTLSTFLTGFGTIGSQLNTAQGATIPNMISGFVGAISNVLLTVLLCEPLGPPGAAVATVISYALAVLILWRSIRLRSFPKRNAPGVRAT